MKKFVFCFPTCASSLPTVNEFSKKTGDYASLSLADIKVLALTYELEVEVQGNADHLNKEPRKIITEVAATKASRRQKTGPQEFNDPPEEVIMRRVTLFMNCFRADTNLFLFHKVCRIAKKYSKVRFIFRSLQT